MVSVKKICNESKFNRYILYCTFYIIILILKYVEIFFYYVEKDLSLFYQLFEINKHKYIKIRKIIKMPSSGIKFHFIN